jgi:hypothetical protein
MTIHLTSCIQAGWDPPVIRIVDADLITAVWS